MLFPLHHRRSRFSIIRFSGLVHFFVSAEIREDSRSAERKKKDNGSRFFSAAAVLFIISLRPADVQRKALTPNKTKTHRYGSPVSVLILSWRNTRTAKPVPQQSVFVWDAVGGNVATLFPLEHQTAAPFWTLPLLLCCSIHLLIPNSARILWKILTKKPKKPVWTSPQYLQTLPWDWLLLSPLPGLSG